MSASDWTPGGAQTRSKQASVFGGPPFPQTINHAMGSRVWESPPIKMTNGYIDWMSALASVGLGYGYWPVEEAVNHRRWDNGVAFPLPTKLEYEVAELLCDTLKWPQQVRWVKTGSEATAAAMMIARRATGRKKIVSIGYHGWHECHLPSENLVDVPWGSWPGVLMFNYDVAAILVEPMRDHDIAYQRVPVEQYLRRLQDMCKETGALFILDEMVTGFRWAIGGAGEYFGITPDLACYGKAMANGYALAAVIGPRKLMKHALDVSSTFGGECVGLAAAKATINVYRSEPVIERLWEVGRMLQRGCPSLKGYPVRPWLDLGEDQRIAVVQYAAGKGVLLHPAGMNPTYSHSDADVLKTIGVINEAVASLVPGDN